MTKIKSDFLGLYLLAGGYISRPFYGTMFKEGDSVNSKHFSGSIFAGVTYPTGGFKKDDIFEFWTTTDISNSGYKKMSNSEIETKTEWYKNHINDGVLSIYMKNNEDFKNRKK